jgi:hypothetical protein
VASLRKIEVCTIFLSQTLKGKDQIELSDIDRSIVYDIYMHVTFFDGIDCSDLPQG